MYTKEQLEQRVKETTHIDKLRYFLCVKPNLKKILQILKDNDELLVCSFTCFYKGVAGTLLLLKDRIAFKDNSILQCQTDIYVKNIAAFEKKHYTYIKNKFFKTYGSRWESL